MKYWPSIGIVLGDVRERDQYVRVFFDLIQIDSTLIVGRVLKDLRVILILTKDIKQPIVVCRLKAGLGVTVVVGNTCNSLGFQPGQGWLKAQNLLSYFLNNSSHLVSGCEAS